jgi:hypothetical protein
MLASLFWFGGSQDGHGGFQELGGSRWVFGVGPEEIVAGRVRRLGYPNLVVVEPEFLKLDGSADGLGEEKKP